MKRKILTLCLVLVVTFITTLYLPAEKTIDPATVDKVFEKWNKPGSPGCALAVVKDGKIVYKNGYGLANLELDIRITPQSVFYIGSVSKQFVAFSIALLEARGKLDFDDDIRKYIPEMPDYGTTVTIRHLIHHTSGIRGYLTLLDLAGLDLGFYHTAEDVINNIVARQENLNFTPGKKYQYSNSGYLILADIVRRVSGKSFRQFTEENIFKPLGMKNSRFHDNYTELIKNRASSYYPKGKNGYVNFISTFDLVGSGGLYTTVEDLFLWDQNFYHHNVGGPELQETIHTPGKLNNGEETDYAFALMHGKYKGLKIVEHGGALGGYRAMLMRFPEQHFSVICLSNLGSFNPTRVAYQVADIFLADQFKPEPKEKKKKKAYTFAKLKKKHLENKTGAYRNNEDGTILKISVKDDRLTAFDGRNRFVLAPLSKERFKLVEPPLDLIGTFTRKNKKDRKNRKNNLPRFTFRTVYNGKPWRVYEPVKTVSPTPEELKEYTGAFFSRELNVTYKFVVEDGKLFIKFRTAPEPPLTPTIKDEFTLQGMAFSFTRENGKINGFNMKGSTISGISFNKTK